MSGFTYNRADDFPAGGGEMDSLFGAIRDVAQRYGEYRRYESAKQGDYFTGVGLVQGIAGEQMLLGAAIQPDYIFGMKGLAEVHRAVPRAAAVLSLKDEIALLYEEEYLHTQRRRPPVHVFERCTAFIGPMLTPVLWSRGYILEMDNEAMALGHRYEWQPDGSITVDHEGQVPRMLNQECIVLNDVVCVLNSLARQRGMQSRPNP